MTDLGEQFGRLVASIKKAHLRTHSEVAMLGTAIVEDKLRKALLHRMRTLTDRETKDLFENYGPLSSFAAKIDLSYALKIIDKPTHRQLTIVRRIRNTFAHPEESLNFQSPAIREHLHGFEGYNDAISDLKMFFLERLRTVDKYLDNAITRDQQLEP